MSKYSNYNIVYRLQKWMDSVPGQTFLNYAYSWGASVVILGTLFKLTHLPGANFMLFLGMGTEVVVFFLSAFDRPFDKTAEGRDLPTHLDEEGDSENAQFQEAGAAALSGVSGVGGGTIIFAGGMGNGVEESASADGGTTKAVEGQSFQGAQQIIAGGVMGASVPGTEHADELAEAQGDYVEQLKNLTETLKRVSEQSERLTRDSEEMENLNRTLTGICKVYEMQLKGASKQIGTIDQINEQSRKMAEQIEQLNKIYTRMIEAMTVNMRAAAPNIEKD